MIKRIGIALLLIAIALVLGISLFFKQPPTLSATTKDRVQSAVGSELALAGLEAYTIREGRHFSVPRIFKLRNRPEKVSWIVAFADNGQYDLGDEDQKDWNKLLGLFFNFFNTLDNTVMVGWRWNPASERMELNGYFHVDGSREFSKPLLDVALEEPFRIDILIDYEEKTYTVLLESLRDGTRASDSKAFTHNLEKCLEINTYFGGNEQAPQDITVHKAYLE